MIAGLVNSQIQLRTSGGVADGVFGKNENTKDKRSHLAPQAVKRTWV